MPRPMEIVIFRNGRIGPSAPVSANLAMDIERLSEKAGLSVAEYVLRIVDWNAGDTLQEDLCQRVRSAAKRANLTTTEWIRGAIEFRLDRSEREAATEAALEGLGKSFDDNTPGVPLSFGDPETRSEMRVKLHFRAICQLSAEEKRMLCDALEEELNV